MRRGNIIAGLLLLPALFMFYLIFSNLIPTNSYVRGWFIFLLICSIIVSGTAYLCLIISNLAYLDSLSAIRAIYPYTKIIRIILLGLVVLLVFLLALSPKKPTQQTKVAQTNCISSHS